MNRTLRKLLSGLLILSMLPVSALAASAINLGGTLGFMYENMSVTLRPRLRGVKSASLLWKSSDPAVAGVTGGKISGVKAGKTTITAAAGDVSASCEVVVLPRSIELTVGQTYQLPNAGQEKYRMAHTAIASVSEGGLITPKSAGTTRLLVAYGRQRLYLTIKINANIFQPSAPTNQSRAAQLDCANQTNQIVLVEYESGSRATLSIHEKQNGIWVEIYSCPAYLGSKGIGKTKEGDQRTPTGTFNLTQPFGIKADPGANMPYTKVNKYHYWCGTSSSEYYNQLVDMRKVDRKNTSSDEHLIRYGTVYNYCMFIDYNAAGEAGKGSCIFLHCLGKNKYTAGCIAVTEPVMKKIIQWAEPGAKIVIK